MGTKVSAKLEGNADILQKRWSELKERVKEEWSQLSNDDIAQMSGQHDELIALLQLRYGYTQDQAVQEINRWLRNQEKKAPVQM